MLWSQGEITENGDWGLRTGDWEEKIRIELFLTKPDVIFNHTPYSLPPTPYPLLPTPYPLPNSQLWLLA
ncbi:hypothetical protein NUACC26_081030 [Scytonema sp. NUACC26]